MRYCLVITGLSLPKTSVQAHIRPASIPRSMFFYADFSFLLSSVDAMIAACPYICLCIPIASRQRAASAQGRSLGKGARS